MNDFPALGYESTNYAASKRMIITPESAQPVRVNFLAGLSGRGAVLTPYIPIERSVLAAFWVAIWAEMFMMTSCQFKKLKYVIRRDAFSSPEH